MLLVWCEWFLRDKLCTNIDNSCLSWRVYQALSLIPKTTPIVIGIIPLTQNQTKSLFQNHCQWSTWPRFNLKFAFQILFSQCHSALLTIFLLFILFLMFFRFFVYVFFSKLESYAHILRKQNKFNQCIMSVFTWAFSSWYPIKLHQHIENITFYLLGYFHQIKNNR